MIGYVGTVREVMTKRKNISREELEAALDELGDEAADAYFDDGPMNWWKLGECLGCFASPPSECACDN